MLRTFLCNKFFEQIFRMTRIYFFTLFPRHCDRVRPRLTFSSPKARSERRAREHFKKVNSYTGMPNMLRKTCLVVRTRAPRARFRQKYLGREPSTLPTSHGRARRARETLSKSAPFDDTRTSWCRGYMRRSPRPRLPRRLHQEILFSSSACVSGPFSRCVTSDF